MGKTAMLTLALFLCGCVTPYQNMGFTGGVDELQVSDVMDRITARGNGYTSSERVQDFVLLRVRDSDVARL